MTTFGAPPRVAVIGAGLAGVAAARSLRDAGVDVTVFDKSRGVGGRLATRRMPWVDAAGVTHTLAFDHGAQGFVAAHARFRALTERAVAAGALCRWRQQVHGRPGEAAGRTVLLPTPGMPALARWLLADVTLRAEATVQRLQRSAGRWRLVLGGGETSGPFDHVVVALPPAQAAALLDGVHDGWAPALHAVPMRPCWTLMAATDDVDWPWDAAVPSRGPLAWVSREDRKPGRKAPAGIATWVAQADEAWSAAHLDDAPEAVEAALAQALAALLPGGRQAPSWHLRVVHRWRYAERAARAGSDDCCWDSALGLGLCGDWLGPAGVGGVEAAWRSGDELADTVIADLEHRQPMPQAA